MLTKIISGGQTGVDRAALDVALALGIPIGGWCPKGRLAEDGPIPAHYPLTETPSVNYPRRTEWNIRDADATLILVFGEPGLGTKLTLRLCEESKKPYFAVWFDLRQGAESIAMVRVWLKDHQPGVLNVAGSRESARKGAYDATVAFLREVLMEAKS